MNAGLHALLATMFFSCCTAQAQVNALPPTPHVLVYGEAQARAIPDRFKIAIGLEAVDPDVDVARAEVEAHVDRILGQLDAAGVPASEVIATSLEIEPSQRYDRKLEEDVYEGISVSRDISARFSSLESLERFLAALETSEQVQVSGIDPELSSEAELRRQLRGKAIASTREKAEVIAKSYGVRLVGLYSVSDVAPDFDYGIQEGSWPSIFRWDDERSSLDRIQVTGSRIEPSFRTGFVTYSDTIYAVFLIAE